MLERIWKVAAGIQKKPNPPADNANEDNTLDWQSRLEDWEEASEQVEAGIRLTVKPGPLAHIADIDNGPDMLAKLQDIYRTKGYTARDLVWRTITRSNLSDYKNVAEYAEAITKARTKLQEMGHKIEDWMITTSFIHGLGDSYEDFVTMILNLRTKDAKGNLQEPDLDAVIEQLIDKERRLKATGESTGKAMKSTEFSKSKDNRGKKKAGNRTSSNEKCSYCGYDSHTDEARCWFKHPSKAPDNWKEQNKNRIDELQKKQANKGKDFSKPKPDFKALVAKAYSAHISPSKDENWYLDSAASVHMTHTNSYYITKLHATNLTIIVADGSAIRASGVGTIEVTAYFGNRPEQVTISNVYYCPELESNLLSLGILEEKGYKFVGHNGTLSVLDSEEETVLQASRDGTLYRANMEIKAYSARAKVAKTSASASLWHRRLAHLNVADVAKLASMVNGMDIDSSKEVSNFCEPCVLGKQHRTPSRTPMTRATTKFERIHTDLGGGGNTLTQDITTDSGNRYYVVFTDDYTRYRWWYPLKRKNDALPALKEFLVMIKNQYGLTPKKLRSDNGGEFNSKASTAYYKELGMIWEPTVPYAPDQNGVAERTNRTLIERARTQLISSGLPPKLWAESLNTAVYITNRVPTRALSSMTPYEAWYGTKPKIQHLRVFGCTAYTVDPKAKDKGKMAPRSKKAVFLGYEGSNQYRLWEPTNEVLIRSRDVIFHEDRPLTESQPMIQSLINEGSASEKKGNGP